MLAQASVVIAKSASDRLRERSSRFDEHEIEHYVCTARILKPFGKEGSTGL